MPDVPTFNEVGWGDYPGQGWWGLAAPKGTPPDDRRAAVRRIPEALQRSEIRQRSWRSRPWYRPRPTPAGFAAFLKQDRQNAETLIKIANTKKTEFKE